MHTSAFETVLLARHGETEWNLVGRRQGQLDSPLTALGSLQAAALAEAAAGLSIDAIFASPLGRAATTAAACSARIGLPVTVIDELAEVNHGRMAGLTEEDVERLFPGELGLRAADKYLWCFPGGESYADVDVRAGVALGRMAASGASRPLIVSHEMVGRMLLKSLLDADPATALGWRHPHDVIYQVDVSTKERRELRLSPALG